MARWSYDVTGAEPIIRDMITELDTYVEGEFAAVGVTDGDQAGFVISGNSVFGTRFVGIFNEGITTTTNIDTPALSLARVVINPFAVYRASYSTSSLITAAGAGPTFTCTSSEGYPNMGGSWLYRVGGTGAGELNLVEDSSVSTTTCTVVTADTATTAFSSDSTFIIIEGQGPRCFDLGDTQFEGGHADAGYDMSSNGMPGVVLGNYIQTTGVPPTLLGNGTTYVGKTGLSASGVNVVFSSDVCFSIGSIFITAVTLA